ncbi:transcription factor IIIB 90 kDa subunit-like [Synchiropus picturatus]
MVRRRCSPALLTCSAALSCSLQPFISHQPSKKVALEQDRAPAPAPALVESGPVVYEDGEDEEEEPEEEEACVSAMELLGGAEYGCDDYDDGF